MKAEMVRTLLFRLHGRWCDWVSLTNLGGKADIFELTRIVTTPYCDTSAQTRLGQQSQWCVDSIAVNRSFRKRTRVKRPFVNNLQKNRAELWVKRTLEWMECNKKEKKKKLLFDVHMIQLTYTLQIQDTSKRELRSLWSNLISCK